MFFQNLIKKSFSRFSPANLIEWQERQDEDLQNEGRTLGIQIESIVKHKVISKLKQLFNDDWDIAIGKIQRECETRAKEQIEKEWKEGLGRREIEWTEMFFITDYKEIISKNWTKQPENEIKGFTPFENDFAIDIWIDFNNKEQKLKWLSIFNNYPNLWAHEGTKEKRLSKKEVDHLKTIQSELV